MCSVLLMTVRWEGKGYGEGRAAGRSGGRWCQMAGLILLIYISIMAFLFFISPKDELV